VIRAVGENKGELEEDMIEDSQVEDGEAEEMVERFEGFLEEGRA
jgi:hypothetical protein